MELLRRELAAITGRAFDCKALGFHSQDHIPINDERGGRSSKQADEAAEHEAFTAERCSRCEKRAIALGMITQHSITL